MRALVLVDEFEDARAQQAGVDGRAGEADGEGRKDVRAHRKVAVKPAQGEQAVHQTEFVEHEHTQPEHRHGVRDETKQGDGAVDQRPALHGRQDAERHADDEFGQEGGDGEGGRLRRVRPEEGVLRHAVVVRDAEVADGDLAEVDPELVPQRQVQA
jgi:hypothetical protein